MAQPPAGQSQIGGKEMQGQEVTVDLPGSLQLRNIGSKVDGQGMCVMSSLTHGGTWQGVPKIAGLREWCAREPGGAGPSKVASQLRRYYGEGQVPPYLQAEGEDAFRLLEWADKTGRMGCITYGYSPRYGHCVNHMTNAVRARGNLGVVLDNNFPGEANYGVDVAGDPEEADGPVPARPGLLDRRPLGLRLAGPAAAARAAQLTSIPNLTRWRSRCVCCS